MKVFLKSAGSGHNAESSADLGQTELWPLASKPPRKAKILCRVNRNCFQNLQLPKCSQFMWSAEARND